MLTPRCEMAAHAITSGSFRGRKGQCFEVASVAGIPTAIVLVNVLDTPLHLVFPHPDPMILLNAINYWYE